MNPAYEFSAKVWRSGAGAGWFFVTLPDAPTQRIRALTRGRRGAFGSLRIAATIGKTTWRTSIWADTKANAFLLPLKAEVRRAEKIELGDEVRVVIEIPLDL